jgi:HTH-type transcriptional regulator/antitoxin HipB
MDYPLFIIESLSQHLRALRKSRGWSQTELASRLGVTQARVATIEQNPSVVSVGQLFEILQLLQTRLVLRHEPLPATPDASGPGPKVGRCARPFPLKTNVPGKASPPPSARTEPKAEW